MLTVISYSPASSGTIPARISTGTEAVTDSGGIKVSLAVWPAADSKAENAIAMIRRKDFMAG